MDGIFFSKFKKISNKYELKRKKDDKDDKDDKDYKGIIKIMK